MGQVPEIRDLLPARHPV